MEVPAVLKKFWQRVFLSDLKNLNPDRIGKYLAHLAPESPPAPVGVGTLSRRERPALQEEWDPSSAGGMSEPQFFSDSRLS